MSTKPENPCMVCGDECSGPFEQDPEGKNGFEGDFWAYCERCDAWTSYPRKTEPDTMLGASRDG